MMIAELKRERSRQWLSAEEKGASAELEFLGRFHAQDFIAFAEHRAQKLDLIIGLKEVSQHRISFSIEGPPPLIDAFEAAMSLGPLSCFVLDVVRTMDDLQEEGR